MDFLFRGINNGKIILGNYVHDRFEDKYYIYSNNYGGDGISANKPIMAFEIEKESLGMCTELRDADGAPLVTRDVLSDENGNMYLFDWDFGKYRFCLVENNTGKKMYRGFEKMKLRGILVGSGEDSRLLEFVGKEEKLNLSIDDKGGVMRKMAEESIFERSIEAD
jgi:hypothetical protein